MPDRRQASRFVLPESAPGMLRLMEDVYVERADAAETTVIATQAVVLGEQVLFELPTSRGRRSVVLAESVRNTLVPFGGAMRYRVVLRILHRCSYDSTGCSEREDLWTGRMGVVVRRIQVSVRDASARGCLLESTRAFPEGAIGILELQTDDGGNAEPLRVSRCVRTPGAAWPYSAGAEFLPLDAPGPTSLRNTVARLEIVLELDSMAIRTSSRPMQSPGLAGHGRTDATLEEDDLLTHEDLPG